jgi:multiple sugar transport system ATP-binding protein
MGQVSLRNIRKNYDATEVIRGIDLDVLEGEFLVFVGPSGCGKSTTLRMIAGLESISGGDLLIDGARANDLRPSDRGAAMVFQSYALYPHMTVEENMGFALKMAGVAKAKRIEQVSKTADVLRITDLLDRYPKELSGGQRQRVAIGRAIVRKPKVFLFDEPLSNLDAALRVDMRIELSRLHKELRTTMIYVTHDQVEAMTMGDRIAVFNKGKIEQIGGPMDLYNRPANAFVAGFIGSPRINFVDRPEHGSTSAAHLALWQVLARDAHGDACRMGVRPEHLGLVASGEGPNATVELVEQLGDSAMVHLRVAGVAQMLIAKLADGSGIPSAGQSVGLQVVDAHRVLAFDRQGIRLETSNDGTVST